METNILFICKKRELGVIGINYCDWFEKRKSNLVKRCCKNCRFFSDEKYKRKIKKENPSSAKEEKKTEES